MSRLNHKKNDIKNLCMTILEGIFLNKAVREKACCHIIDDVMNELIAKDTNEKGYPYVSDIQNAISNVLEKKVCV